MKRCLEKKMVLTVISISEKQVIILKTPKLKIIENQSSNNENLYKLLERKYDISMLSLETVTPKGLNALLNFLLDITDSLM